MVLRYLLADDRELSAWVSAAAGVVGLSVALHLQSVVAPPGIALHDLGPGAVKPGGIVARTGWLTGQA